jgi:ribonuclease HI
VPENECAAAIAALTWVLENSFNKQCKLVIMPDAKYVIGMATGDYKPKTNKQQIKILRALNDHVKRKMDVEFFHLKSHKGHPWNELADALCNASSKNLIKNHDKKPSWEK